MFLQAGEELLSRMEKYAEETYVTMLSRSSSSYSGHSTERSRWPSLTRMLMSGEVSGDAPRDLTMAERYEIWMVNEGSRRLFVGVFVLLHAMVFAFGFIMYDLKDNLTDARGTFGITYPIARAAALVLHVDIALILFRMLFSALNKRKYLTFLQLFAERSSLS